MKMVRLWDLPVRIVHWSLVLLLALLWWTWRQGNMALHEKLGFVMLGLLVFRLLWGIFGSSTARFIQFVRGPRAIALYLRGRSPLSIGHNPLGAWSVIALLGLLSADVGLGLITQDVDGIEAGPLARFVSYETADWARGWHAWLFNAILAAVAIHVLAIAFYLVVKRDNLIGPMLTGRKSYAEPVEEPTRAPFWRAIAAALFSAGLAWWIARGFRI